MGEVVMFSNAIGERQARAIVKEWKPRFKVVSMAAAEFDQLSERCSTTFIGIDADLSDVSNV